ncbi:MAG TPA: iron ABC transporter permease, partial [Rugosimonospora sp.]|nr:iron ABC transporter permease [Rugosimonospora sp.]
MTSSATPTRAGRLPVLRWPARRGVAVLPAVAGLVTLVAVCPLVFIALQAEKSGWSSARRLLGRPLVATLLVHTVTLTLVVTAGTLVLGFATAWTVERTDLPAKRVWTVLAAMPLAVPEFVHGYCWVSLFPQVRGFWGAALVMTSSLYPLVFLPVAAALRRAD